MDCKPPQRRTLRNCVSVAVPGRAKTLDAMVSEYIATFRPARRASRRRFASMPDLSAAIRVAALAQREDGKCESHQRRIGGRLLARYERSLQRVSSEIGKCGTFAELHDVWRGGARSASVRSPSMTRLFGLAGISVLSQLMSICTREQAGVRRSLGCAGAAGLFVWPTCRENCVACGPTNWRTFYASSRGSCGGFAARAASRAELMGYVPWIKVLLTGPECCGLIRAFCPKTLSWRFRGTTYWRSRTGWRTR